MVWVYRLTEGGLDRLYTVGFYTPQGEWCTDSDHESKEAAALRVHYLNGGSSASSTVQDLIEAVESIGGVVTYLGRYSGREPGRYLILRIED